MIHLLTTKRALFIAIALLATALSGCSINDSNKSSNKDLTNEELEVAGQIIAESLSDQKDGIFASLNDAFTLPTSTNLTDNNKEKGKYASAVFDVAMAAEDAGSTNNYSYDYDPSTGIHLVTFNRSVNNENLSKESSAELQYIYYAANGSFIYSPRIDSDLIESIVYQGNRTGSIVSDNKISTYERSDQFTISGLTDGSDVITIEGLHEGSGEFQVTRPNGDVIERDYTLTVEFLDVQISTQAISLDGSLENGVEGTLAYEMVISKNINGDESMKTINGTIEFNGDGTALLRFQNILEDFKVKLGDGDLLADGEFEGFVDTVDPDNETFTLFDGELYLFGSDTEIDPEGDLTTLADVQSALGTGIRVKAEGLFVNNTDGANIVQSVSFEYEEEDLEFEDLVEEADTTANTFTLADGTLLAIKDTSDIDPESDLNDLHEVLWALDNEYSVEAEGNFFPEEDGSFTVLDVKFEYEEELEFDDDVNTVNTDENTFTLDDGETYVIDENTNFDPESDFLNLEDIATALSEGQQVEAEGEYAPQPDGSLLATEVKFEGEDSDDNGDDDQKEFNFDGVVDTADASAKIFTLTNGQIFHVNKETEFDDNIQSLGNLVGALQRGDDVSVEGEYYTNGESNNIVLEAEFDVDRNHGNDDDDDDGEEYEFEGIVSSTAPGSFTFSLGSGLTLFINGDTEFEGDDINSLEELEDALTNGDDVEAEGEYYINDGGENITIEVEFEVENDGDDDGDDDDDEDREEIEFERVVTSTDIGAQTFTLEGGLTIFIDGETEIKDKDFESLEELANALADGDEVQAEGEYYIDDEGDNIAIKVGFEVEEPEELEFDDRVLSADLGTQSFTLESGLTIFLDGDTEIKDKDIDSLEELADALADGDEVQAEGEYFIDEGDENIAIKVEFEVDENDDGDDDSDDDGDDDGDEEEVEFSDMVLSANLAAQSFTLQGGEEIFVDGDTDFKGNDIESLKELADALADGDEVQAEGEYFIDEGDENIAIKVEFEVDENDDGDDDSDDDGDDDGDEEEVEFSDMVLSANLAAQSFTLQGGEEIFVDGDTDFKGNDIESLEELADALADGDDVEADGEYYINAGGENIAIKVEFEVDENDDGDDDSDDDGDDDGDEEEVEFSDMVLSANLAAQSFTLQGGEEIFVDGDTDFKGNDIESLEELADALADGDDVEADGEYYINAGGENIAIKVEFEVDENDDGDDDSDDDGDDDDEDDED